MTYIFLLTVLIMMGTAERIGGFPDHVLPPLARWGWWTASLWVCGLAANYASYRGFADKAAGLLAATLFYASYPLLWGDYVKLIPPGPEHLASWWPTIFVIINVVLPLAAVTIGPIRPVVRMGR